MLERQGRDFVWSSIPVHVWEAPGWWHLGNSKMLQPGAAVLQCNMIQDDLVWPTGELKLLTVCLKHISEPLCMTRVVCNVVTWRGWLSL